MVVQRNVKFKVDGIVRRGYIFRSLKQRGWKIYAIQDYFQEICGETGQKGRRGRPSPVALKYC